MNTLRRTPSIEMTLIFCIVLVVGEELLYPWIGGAVCTASCG